MMHYVLALLYLKSITVAQMTQMLISFLTVSSCNLNLDRYGIKLLKQ